MIWPPAISCVADREEYAVDIASLHYIHLSVRWPRMLDVLSAHACGHSCPALVFVFLGKRSLNLPGMLRLEGGPTRVRA
jgi:hypothetical protein